MTPAWEDPKTIFLQPWCGGCATAYRYVEEGRSWCEDDVWEKCEDCTATATRYILAGPAEAEIARLTAELVEVRHNADHNYTFGERL